MKYFCKEKGCKTELKHCDGVCICPVCNSRYVINFHNKPILVQKGIDRKFLRGTEVECKSLT